MISREMYVSKACELIAQKVDIVVQDKVEQFSKDNPNELVTTDIREEVHKRLLAELMFRVCSFKVSEDEIDEMEYESRFNDWFDEKEAREMDRMALSYIQTEVNKCHKPEEGNLSFTERYLKRVEEAYKNKDGKITGIE